MKRAVWLALMISLLAALGGCGGEGDMARWTAWQAALPDTPALTGEVTALTEDSADGFTLRCQRDSGGDTVEVLAPAELAGVQVTLSEAGDALTAQGLTLALAPLTTAGLTPLSALPALLDAMQTGTVSAIGRESDGETLTMAVTLAPDGDGCAVKLWLDWQTLTPLYAELSQDGTAVLRLRVTDWHT